MSALSDRDLIASAQRGEAGAFATLVGRHRDAYTRFAVRMLGGADAADEALQTAFVRAYQSVGRCKEPEQFADWLFRFVIHECRARALRRVVRERRATGEMPAVGAAARPLAPDGEAMQRVVDQIDPVLREPFVLQYIEELSYVRIASLTSMPVQTLERQVDRACARLRELLPPATQETKLSSAGLELLSSEPAPSLAVQVAMPLRRPEVLNDSFEDRLMAKLLRASASPETAASGEADAGAATAPNGAGGAPLPPPSPWTIDSAAPAGSANRRLYAAVAGVAACLALASFIAGYAARRWRDVRDVERRRPSKPTVVNKIVRRTDTVRVARSDTVVLARFDFMDNAARSVSLVGDFNDWNPATNALQPGAGKGAWTTVLSLTPGRHEYAFLVDGKHWVLDRFTRASHEEFGVPTSVLALGGDDVNVPPEAASARARLKKMLPRDIGDRVLSRIAKAKEQGLPSGTLEQEALKLAAHRTAPKDIERSVIADADRLARSRQLLVSASRSPSASEVVAGADVMRAGGDSSAVVEIARAVPSHRSAAVPLGALAELVAGGMNSQEAVDKIRTRVHNEATDAALQRWADETVMRLASTAKPKAAKLATRAHNTDVRQAGSPKGTAKKASAPKKTAAPPHKTTP